MAKKRLTKKTPTTSRRKFNKEAAISLAVFAAIVVGSYALGRSGNGAARTEGCRTGVSALATSLFGQAPEEAVNQFCDNALSK